MEIVGKIKKIMEVQNISDKFRKREFVICTDWNSPYPQYILFQTIQDKCSILDNLKENDEVKVLFNIRGREWTNPEGQIKYFVSLEAWRIDKFTPVEATPSPSSTSSDTTTTSPFPNASANIITSTNAEADIQNANDDLPF